jgi:hypothetical protein
MPLQLALALGGRHAARTLFARKSSRYFPMSPTDDAAKAS